MFEKTGKSLLISRLIHLGQCVYLCLCVIICCEQSHIQNKVHRMFHQTTVQSRMSDLTIPFLILL